MRLKVTGVEEIVITDPNRVCGTRKHLDQNLLLKLKGQDFTAQELKAMFGYGTTTALADTQLKRLIEPVKGNKRSIYAEKSTRWRLK